MLELKAQILAALIIENFQFTATNFAGFAVKNIAGNQTTNQSSDLNCSSHLAVTENLEEFSCTKPESFNWWFVRFASQKKVAVIKVYSQNGLEGTSSQRVSIRTATITDPGTPTPSNSIWTVALSVQRFTKKLVKSYSPVTQLLYIAVTSEVEKSLTINQVEVHAYSDTHNVVRGKSAAHSANANEELALANDAVNGMFDDFASPATGSNSYWRINLQQSYNINSIRIHNGANYSALQNPRILISLHYTTGVLFYKGPNPSRFLTRIQEDFRIKDISTRKIIETFRIKNDDTSTYMRLAEVEMFVERNLALKKPASKSSSGNEPASRAVNGFHGDYAVVVNRVRWWCVDLLEIYSVADVHIVHLGEGFRSYDNYAVHSAKLSQQWIRRVKGNKIRGKTEIIVINSPREMRYVNITDNERGYSIILSQVIVHEYNFALGYSNASQSSTAHSNINQYWADRAVDHSSQTYAATDFYTHAEQWWSVKLPKLIMMTSVEIYHAKGVFNFSQQEDRIKKDDYYTTIELKTSIEEFPPAVSLGDDSHWTICLTQSVEFPVRVQHLECERNRRWPIIKHLSILTALANDRLVLEEVEIFGRELPEFPSDATATVVFKDYTSFQLAFNVWNGALPGAHAPSLYAVKLNNSEEPRMYHHKHFVETGEVIANCDNLEIGTTYKYTITCQFKNVQCPGKVFSGVVETEPCYAPERPRFNWTIEDDGGLKLKVAVNKSIPNCARMKEYRVILETDGDVTYNQSGRWHVIDGIKYNTYYKLIVMATNYQDLKNSTEEDLVAGEAVPEKAMLISSDFNSSCVRLQVENPSNYRFPVLDLKSVCTSVSYSKQSTVNGSEMKQVEMVFCGFPPDTKIRCTTILTNHIGDSKKLIVFGLTLVEEVSSEALTTPGGNLLISRELTVALSVIGGAVIVSLTALVVKIFIVPSIRVKPEKSGKQLVNEEQTEKKSNNL